MHAHPAGQALPREIVCSSRQRIRTRMQREGAEARARSQLAHSGAVCVCVQAHLWQFVSNESASSRPSRPARCSGSSAATPA